MNLRMKQFFTSGWVFDESNLDEKAKFQMINIAIVLSSASLFYGIVANIFRGIYGIISVELFLLVVNFILLLTLRKNKDYFQYIAFIITFQFTVFFLFLLYAHEPSALKHIWLFTYPIILLYLQSKKHALYWFSLLLFFILLAPIQPFFEVKYSVFQVTYISFVLVIISIIINFYSVKMQEAKDLITHQEIMLQNQAKQAVMGEMISMIAHQWRQPLSTVTLSISNMQIKKLLGEEIPSAVVDKTLEEISDSLIYLSDTIDDFQTYFRPNKELSSIEIHELLQKPIGFVLARLKGTKIDLRVKQDTKINVDTYMNELVQVILNILNNAIDALIETKRKDPKILLSVVQTSEKIIISIEDNASGISKENQAQIFHPYFSTKGENGTGLGLYMSQMIIQKQFNGRIYMESSPQGTIFYVEIQKELL